MNIKTLIEELKSFQGKSTFNPYTDVCKFHDKADAPNIRIRNLELTLNSFLESEVDSIWVGRDLGYLGGRRTGLALTDEARLDRAGRLWNTDLQKATNGAVRSERTATSIWNYLEKIDEHIFLWNVFPYHPYEEEKELSNRSHTAKERDFGMRILELLISILKPLKIVGIGNDAYNCLTTMFPKSNVVKVRHPSYGGVREFAQQLGELYNLKDRRLFGTSD